METYKINLFRLWILASVIWATGVVVYMQPDFGFLENRERSISEAPRASRLGNGGRFDSVKAERALFPERWESYNQCLKGRGVTWEWLQAQQIGIEYEPCKNFIPTETTESTKTLARVAEPKEEVLFSGYSAVPGEIYETITLIIAGIIGMQVIPRGARHIWRWLHSTR